jgi:DNA polymerase-3 subunit epsilon
MTINKCLIVDTETTGIDPKDHMVIEIAAILYSVEANDVIGMAAMILPAEENPAEEINHISPALLNTVEEEGEVIKGFSSMLYAMMETADVIVAHQASFDKGHLTKENLEIWSSKPWLCTKEDFKFSKGKPGDSLVNLALAHNVPVHGNHRAGVDVNLIAKIFRSYSAEELQALFQHALLPRDYYVALTNFVEKEKPKNAGFSWNGEKKCWWKKLTPTEASKLDFPIRKVSPEAINGR